MSDTETQVIPIDLGGNLDGGLEAAAAKAHELGDALDSVESNAKNLREALAGAVISGDKGGAKQITSDLKAAQSAAGALKAALADAQAPAKAAAAAADKIAEAEKRATEEAKKLAKAQEQDQKEEQAAARKQQAEDTAAANKRNQQLRDVAQIVVGAEKMLAAGDVLGAAGSVVDGAASKLIESGDPVAMGAGLLLEAATALASAFEAGEKLAIDMGSKRELNEKSFEKLGKGPGYTEHIQKLALDVGGDPEKTAEDARRLIAAHLSDKRVDMTIKATADVGQLLGGEKGEAIKTAVEKLANKDKFDQAAIKSLTKAGLNENDIIAQLMTSMHESRSDVMAKIKTGAIDTGTAIDAVNAAAEKLAGGMAKDAADTVPKLFDRLKFDAMSLFDDPKLEGGFKKFLKDADAVITGPEGKELKDGLTGILGAFSEGLLGVDLGKGDLKGFVHELADKLKEAKPAAKEFGESLHSIGSAATAILPAITAAAGAIQLIASAGLLGKGAQATANKSLFEDGGKNPVEKQSIGSKIGTGAGEGALSSIYDLVNPLHVINNAFSDIRGAVTGKIGWNSTQADMDKNRDNYGMGDDPGGAVKAANNNAGPAGAAGNMIGVNLGEGITAGINSQTGAVDASAAALANSAEASARAASGTHSPSTKWAAMAVDWGAGAEAGLGRAAAGVSAAAASMATGAMAGAPAAGGGRGGTSNVYHIALAPMPSVNVPPGTSPEQTKAHTEAATRGHHESLMRFVRDLREAG